MGEHLIDSEFQSDKYPECPPGKVPLSTEDPDAQPLLWIYAQRRRCIDPEFSVDLEEALRLKGYVHDIDWTTKTPTEPGLYLSYLIDRRAVNGPVVPVWSKQPIYYKEIEVYNQSETFWDKLRNLFEVLTDGSR